MTRTGTVVLLGARDDAHVQEVARRLRAEDMDTVVVDTRAFPEQTRLSLTESLDGIVVDGREVGRPAAVYLRGLHAHPMAFGVDAQEAMDADWRTTLTAFREKSALLLGLLGRWERLGVPLYNPPSSDGCMHKPAQLAALQAVGLPVPQTLWTNDAEAVRRFARKGRVAYKPISGGAATRELSAADLTDERLAALAAAPVTFQELLPGESLRVYVLDGAVIASLRIVSSALDFRQHEERIEQVPLPPEVARDCVRACEVLGLRWTGMDLKRDADGVPRILELNGSAMFLGFDARGGTDVAGHLARALARHARGG
ncbi:RimK family alpha-L-glutamate ligase [Myxococcus sp. AM009]|uniref:RimK family alpha-L-glutamate ligase n=1 Tax=Myxococcus sp. AM009 TaxID=2745137 RepID=UPI0034D23690